MTILPSRAMLAFAVLTSFAGCGGEDPTGAEPPGSGDCSNVFMRVTAGDDQLGRPGQALGAEVTVRVTDQSGSPLAQAGECIEWTVLEGGGAVSGATATDASGAGQAVWTLGPAEGVQVLRAKVGSLATRDVYAVAFEDTRPIAFVADPRARDQGGDGGQLFLMEEDGTDATPLTSGVYVDEAPSWSPDGTRIAFLRRFADVCTPIQGDVVVLDLTSLTSSRLTDDGDCAEAFGLDWSPDGESIVLSRDDDLVVISLTDGSRRTVAGTPAREIRPSWGTEGIAYSRDEGPDQAKTVHLLPGGTGSSEELLGDGGSDYNVSGWSTDGSKLVVGLKTPAGSLNWSLSIYDFATAELTGVSGTRGTSGGAFSPDRARMIATVRSNLADGSCSGPGSDHLVEIDLETGNQTPITEVCGTPSRGADWRPTV